MSARVGLVVVPAIIACGSGTPSARPPDTSEETPMGSKASHPNPSAATSPTGEAHPGSIDNEDQVGTPRQWTDAADSVPQGVGWVRMGETWEPVLRIVSTGTPTQRRITRFGRNGKMLDSTVQAPPPPQTKSLTPTPTPTPTPDKAD